MEHNRVIIVGTIPYNKNTSSRAFDAYFHNWEKKNMRQNFFEYKDTSKGALWISLSNNRCATF